MNRLATNRLSPLYSIAIVLIAIVALIYVVSILPIDALRDIQFRSVSIWVFLLVMLLHLIYLILSVEVWRRMLFAVIGYRSNFADAYLHMASVAAGKYVPGKVWGVVARTGQLHRAGVSTGMSIASTVIEQLLVFFGGGFVMICVAFFVFPEWSFEIFALGAVLLSGLAFLSRYVPEISTWAQRRLGASDRSLPVVSMGLRRWVQFSFLHAAVWLVSGATLCVIFFFLFDVAVTAQRVAALVLANTIGFIVGFLAIFAPGGIGVREATTVAVLTPFFSVGEALLAAVVLRALIVLFDGINCGILIVGEFRQTTTLTEQERN